MHDRNRLAALLAIASLGTALSGRAADFTVTPNISGGFGNYRWDVQVNGGAATGNPTLDLEKGRTYTFQVNTNAIHPFWIKTAPSTGSANAYAGAGLSANGVGTTALVTFTVPADAPAVLYYDCGNHLEMQAPINIHLDRVFGDGFEGM